MFTFEIKDDGLAGLAHLARGLNSPRPLMRALAGTLEAETEKNFAAQGRPKWLGLQPATLRRRGGTAQILQDTGQLAASIVSSYGRTEARVGSNKPYAAIHQFGGKIERAAYSSWVRLRTNAAGDLLRQGSDGRAARLAVFAKAGHKRARTVRYTTAGHTINMPARPFLPALGDGRIQPEALAALQADIQAFLRTLVR